MQTASKVYKDNWLDLQKGNVLLISTIKPLCKHHLHHHHHHDCVPVKPCPPMHHQCDPCPVLPIPPHHVPVKPCPPMHHEHCVPCDPCEPCHPHHEHHHHSLPPKKPIDIDGDGWTEDIILFGKAAPTQKKVEEPVVMINDEDVDFEQFVEQEKTSIIEDYQKEYINEEETTELICEAPAIEENIWTETTSAEEIVEEKLETIEPVEEVVEETPKRRINRGGRRKATK